MKMMLVLGLYMMSWWPKWCPTQG